MPTGGFRYCAAPGGVGQKYCFYRPGPQTAFCAGSPALGGTAIAPGTYYTPHTAGGGSWISYACFEGCAASDPSVSMVPPLNTTTVPSYTSQTAASFTSKAIAAAPVGGNAGAYTYSWAQTSGPTGKVYLSGATSNTVTVNKVNGVTLTPSFFVFRVTVTDNLGATVQKDAHISLY